MKNKQVDLGAVRLSASVAEGLLEHPDFAAHVRDTLRRFRDCDWGPITDNDRARNEEALADPFNYGEVFAAYEHPCRPEWEICVLTEIGGWKPNQTTVTLPDDDECEED